PGDRLPALSGPDEEDLRGVGVLIETEGGKHREVLGGVVAVIGAAGPDRGEPEAEAVDDLIPAPGLLLDVVEGRIRGEIVDRLPEVLGVDGVEAEGARLQADVVAVASRELDVLLLLADPDRGGRR